MWVEPKKFITFSPGVINATMESKSKTEKIQIIVKAAPNHVNINELRRER